jgi:tetratricopeptide (TPR) repeat protein
LGDGIEVLDGVNDGGWRVMLRSAARWLGQGDVPRAAALLEAASLVAPQRPEILLAMGRLRTRQGQYDEAERLLREAWTRGRRPVAACALARLLARDQSRPDDADAVLREALDFDPECAPLWAARGEVAILARDVGLARRCFERALKIESALLPARIGLARALAAEAFGHLGRGEPSRALFLLGRARHLDPGWSVPAHLMASAFERLGCQKRAGRERQHAARLEQRLN